MVEERDQFEEANNKIVAHLKTRVHFLFTSDVLLCYFLVPSHLYSLYVLSEFSQEDELLKSIASCKAESNVLNIWINFLEDTWNIQCLYRENKEKEVKYVF